MQTSSVEVPCKSSLRLFFIGLLIVVIIGQLIAMVLLMQSQVRTAEERSATDASSRLAAARCFGSSSRSDTNACELGKSPSRAIEATDNVPPVTTAADNHEPTDVVPVGFAAH